MVNLVVKDDWSMTVATEEEVGSFTPVKSKFCHSTKPYRFIYFFLIITISTLNDNEFFVDQILTKMWNLFTENV